MVPVTVHTSIRRRRYLLKKVVAELIIAANSFSNFVFILYFKTSSFENGEYKVRDEF